MMFDLLYKHHVIVNNEKLEKGDECTAAASQVNEKRN